MKTPLPVQIRAEVDRARSAAANKHADRRTRRVRTRSAAKRAALKGW